MRGAEVKKSAYAQKLLDPRWQKKRLEILQRDEWCCQQCFDNESTLHVHHRRYIYGRDPWDYPDQLLVALCASCHEEEGAMMQEAIPILIEQCKDRLFAGEIMDLASSVDHFGMFTVINLALLREGKYELKLIEPEPQEDSCPTE
jgi:hypothetical protein